MTVNFSYDDLSTLCQTANVEILHKVKTSENQEVRKITKKDLEEAFETILPLTSEEEQLTLAEFSKTHVKKQQKKKN